MPQIGSTSRPNLAQAVGTPNIYNLSMPTANTEYSQVLTDGTKKILIKLRGNAKARLAFVANDTTVKYITLEGRAVYSEDGLSLSGVTLYIQSDQASQVAEILEWT